MNGLSVIIPSRNAANLVPCVEALRKNEFFGNIIVVEDFPTEGALIELRDDLSDHGGLGVGSAGKICTIVGGEKPFIFARNVNLGINAAGADDVVILNDDALLQTPGGFSLLQKVAEARPEYGLIASTCNNVGNPNQWAKQIGFRDEPRMVCFVAVLIPRRTLETVGLLDERFVNYGMDDDDYSLRVRNAGLKIGIHDGCYVDHGSLTSSYRGEAGAGGDYLPNMRLFIDKWGVDNWGRDRARSPFRHLFPAVVSA